MKEDKPNEYDLIKQKFKEQFRTGKSLFSKGGAFAPLLEEIINEMLEGELDAHLDGEQRSSGNRKNGKGTKVLKTSSGSIEINTPRDRLSTFEPELIKKRETIMADSLEDKIISMYGLGTSLRDISSHIKDTYNTEIGCYLEFNNGPGYSPGQGMAAATFRKPLLHRMAGCDVL